jgi:O-antigen/teichoic acid export membrane protein
VKSKRPRRRSVAGTVAAVPADVTSGDPAGTRRRAARDVAVQLVGRALNLALGVVVTAAVARALGDQGFGEWSTLLVVTQIAEYLAELGVEQVGVRKAAAEGGREAEWMGAVVSLRSLISVPATIVSAVAVVLLANDDAMLTAGLLLSATVLLNGPASTRALLQLRLRNDLNMVVITVNSVVWGGAAIVLAISGAGLVAFAVAFLAAACITEALQAGLALRIGRISLRAGRAMLRELVRIGLPIAAGGLLILAYGRIDQILVFELAGASDAGLYGVVYRLLEQSQFLPIAISTTFLPLVAAAHPADPERTRRMVQLAADYLAIGSLPALAFALVAAEPFIRLIFGDDFTDAAPALPVLMGAFVVICLGYLMGNMVVVLSLQRRFMIYAACALVFNVALNLALVPEYGFMAAAWITLATEILVVGLTARTVLVRLELRPRLDRMARAVLAAGLMAGVVALLNAAGAPALVLMGATVVYPALLLALRALSLGEIRELVGRRGATTETT